MGKPLFRPLPGYDSLTFSPPRSSTGLCLCSILLLGFKVLTCFKAWVARARKANILVGKKERNGKGGRGEVEVGRVGLSGSPFLEWESFPGVHLRKVQYTFSALLMRMRNCFLLLIGLCLYDHSSPWMMRSVLRSAPLRGFYSHQTTHHTASSSLKGFVPVAEAHKLGNPFKSILGSIRRTTRMMSTATVEASSVPVEVRLGLEGGREGGWRDHYLRGRGCARAECARM